MTLINKLIAFLLKNLHISNIFCTFVCNYKKNNKHMKQKKKTNEQDIAIKAMKKANREIELARNGGRWIAINRPHKNLKKYDRKRDKKINFDLSL
jgi:spore germination protein GerM